MKKLSLFLLTLACVFQFSAQAQERPSYIAIEANSGKLLFSSNAEEKRPVASLSQVATAMVALDWVARTRLPLDTFIAVPQEAFGLRAGNPMDLQPGDRLTKCRMSEICLQARRRQGKHADVMAADVIGQLGRVLRRFRISENHASSIQ